MTVIMTSYRKEAMLQIRSGARQRLEEAANAIRNAVLVTLTGERSGRQYFVPGTRKPYRASSPGDAPASATGMLRQNVYTSIDRSGLMARVGIPEKSRRKAIIGKANIGASMEYGVHLEYGTSKMKARPWLRPSFEKSLAQVKEILGRPWV